MIQLGEKLENPYTVVNFTKALSSVYPEADVKSLISPTHNYFRFLPKNEDEYNRLVSLGLVLMDHPVDYKIVKEGDYYHDPEIPEGEFTWQYASVRKGMILPAEIEKELIDPCFIPEGQVTLKNGVEIDWSAVEQESFRLTGNEGLFPCSKAGTRASEGPSGRIFIHDDRLGEDIGVSGVQVSCNVFVKFASAYTDEDGYYRMDRTFSNDPRYRIVFKNEKGFAIGFNLVIIPASISTLGRGPATGLDCFVTKDSDRMLFSRCVVNNAVKDYFDMCKDASPGISTPPSNLRIWLMGGMGASSSLMLQQGAVVDGSFLEKYLGQYLWVLKMFLPDITVGLVGREDYASLYSIALHQCAHASHFCKVGTGYWNSYLKYIMRSFITTGTTYGTGSGDGSGNCEITEMWAYYLEERLYNDRYASDPVVYGEGNWFYPQILRELNAMGIDKYRIFQILTSDIDNREILQAKLLSMYPEFKSDINKAFDQYQ